MIVAIYLTTTFLVGYLIGNINFARIFTKIFAHEDITKLGSGNPGTMNMLRTQGFGPAFLTLIFDAVKCGAPALGAYFLFETYFPGFGNFAFFLCSFGAVIGHIYPVLYKFKGGKGVACCFGMFIFHPTLWWVALATFACAFVAFFFIQYPFIISFMFLTALSVYSTVIFTVRQITWYSIILGIIWLNFALIVFMHRGNLRRLFLGQENRVNFAEKVFKRHFEKKKSVNATNVNLDQETEEIK